MPKLFLYATPGAIFNKEASVELEAEVYGLQSQSIGQGIHYIQGDEPDAIGEALANWLPSILG